MCKKSEICLLNMDIGVFMESLQFAQKINIVSILTPSILFIVSIIFPRSVRMLVSVAGGGGFIA
ncbi:hypothetical protein [Helicobacter labetoulli]|uniref:hypothetical protein n=1 Tax=Helicobacter labetoulli TaxID=2315333 RepID=UPI001300916A|nr:hypothetical protein [Helicobacter labetoulli]